MGIKRKFPWEDGKYLFYNERIASETVGAPALSCPASPGSFAPLHLSFCSLPFLLTSFSCEWDSQAWTIAPCWTDLCYAMSLILHISFSSVFSTTVLGSGQGCKPSCHPAWRTASKQPLCPAKDSTCPGPLPAPGDFAHPQIAYNLILKDSCFADAEFSLLG